MVDVVLVDVLVIIDRCRDENIVVGVLCASEIPVYKEALYPEMAHAAGVTGQVYTLRQSVVATDDRGQTTELRLQKLGCFVDEKNVPVVALELTLNGGGIVRHIGEFDFAAVYKGQKVFCLVVGSGFLRQQLQHGLDDGVFQLVVLSSDNKDLDSGIIQGQQNSLADNCPALTTATGAAVTGVFHRGKEETPLRFRVWCAEVNRDSLLALCGFLCHRLLLPGK